MLAKCLPANLSVSILVNFRCSVFPFVWFDFVSPHQQFNSYSSRLHSVAVDMSNAEDTGLLELPFNRIPGLQLTASLQEEDEAAGQLARPVRPVHIHAASPNALGQLLKLVVV